MPNENGKVSMEELLTQAAGGTIKPAPVAETPPAKTEEEPAKTEETTEAEPEKEEDAKEVAEAEAESKPEPKKEDKPAEKPAEKVNPMKEVRDKFNAEKASREKIESVMQKFTDGDYTIKLKDFSKDGKINYDELSKAMDEADNKVKAEAKGISPEVQAEITRIDKEKVEIEKQKLQISMDRALNNLQLDKGLKGPEINNFFKDAMALNKNPYRWLAQGGDLSELYFLIYKDKLIKTQVDAAVAEARGKFEGDTKRLAKAPVANPAQQATPSTTNPAGLTMAALLEEAAKKTR